MLMAKINTPRVSRKELLDLAEDLRDTSHVHFFIRNNGSDPNCFLLSDAGKGILEMALRYQAQNDTDLE